MTTARRLALSAALLTPSAALAETATFDAWAEGLYGTAFTDGGITFYAGDHDGRGSLAAFAVENVASRFGSNPALAPHFTGPNILQLAGFGSGPDGYFVPRLQSLSMTIHRPAIGASVDVFHDTAPEFNGTVVRLDGVRNGQVVATASFTIDGTVSRGIAHRRLSIAGAAFDSVRLHAWGGPTGSGPSGILGSVDNVVIVPASVAPACRADFDRNGTVQLTDVFAFLNAFIAGDPRADFDLDGRVVLADMMGFLTVWFSGC